MNLIYIFFLPVIYWCVDEKKGLHLWTAVLFSIWLNLVIINILSQPIPSGHAQTSLVIFFVIATWFKKKMFYGIAAALCLLTGFYLFHTGISPMDILAGWVIGGVLFCVWFFSKKHIEKLLTAGGLRAGMIAAAALSFIMILYRPFTEMLMPGGMLLGLAAGFCLGKKYPDFSISQISDKTGFAKYIILAGRCICGIAIFVLLFYATGKLTALFQDTGNYDLIVFARYAILAIWVSAGAPRLFRLTRLTDKHE